jgi:hypothetical protein
MQVSNTSDILSLINKVFADKQNKGKNEAVKQHVIQVASKSNNPKIHSLVDLKG